MSWGWKPIADEPTGGEGGGGGWISWWWTIQDREHEAHDLEIRVSRTLVQTAGPDTPADLREAVVTRGRSEITRIGLWEVPPERIELNTGGRRRVGGAVAVPR